MGYWKHISIDFSALVDIISNIAGMMILLACVALFVHQKLDSPTSLQDISAKPISFPLAYIPKKRSLTLCLRYGNLYELPEKELLESVSEKTVGHETVKWLTLSKNGVDAAIEVTPTFTGFRFEYKLNKKGGIPLNSPSKTVEALDRIIEEFPPDKFFYVFHTWPENFGEFREIREYLLENGVEVGWAARSNDTETTDHHAPDIAYSMGEYDENLTTIKAQ